MREIASERHGVAIVLTSGERVVVTRDDSTSIVAARLRDAFAAHRRGASDDVVAALVARDERNVPEWLDHLRGLRLEGYRAGHLHDEALLRVVEDPRAASDVRAGAVVLLKPTLDEVGRERIRIASTTVAEPRLRIALDELADAERDVEIEKLLESLRADE